MRSFGSYQLSIDALLCALIISNVAYTEIDWTAYMQEVSGVFHRRQLDYAHLAGDTGPLVYPAGFVWIFGAFWWLLRMTLFNDTQFDSPLSGSVEPSAIRTAQWIFVGLYLVHIWLSLKIYKITFPQIHRWPLVALSLSKRLHSIFLLRLFNDPVAVIVMQLSILALLKRRLYLAGALFSLAVSVKMNILLFLPAFGLILLRIGGLQHTFLNCLLMVIVQVVIGAPFLLSHPVSYLSRSFNLSRVFMYEWTVNWRMVSEHLFLDVRFGYILLALHVVTLLLFAHFGWLRRDGGLLSFLTSRFQNKISDTTTNAWIVTVLFQCQLVGMVFARSLHYQFYSWYFYTLSLLVYISPLGHYLSRLEDSLSFDFKVFCKLITLKNTLGAITVLLLLAIEYCWNVFPSTVASSCILLVSHLVLVIACWFTQLDDEKKLK